MHYQPTEDDLWDDLESEERSPNLRAIHIAKSRSAHRPKLHRPPHLPSAGEVVDLTSQSDTQEHFEFTYKASRHEQGWLLAALGPFYEEQWLDDILRLIKGGKEATVYQCLANPSAGLDQPYLAAKVYRPRRFRSLKNDAVYREGRAILDTDGLLVKNDRELHAVAKRSSFGSELAHTSWIEHEYQTLEKLFAAGADIPRPYARANNTILMEYIGGDDVPAPTLNTVELGRREAVALYRRVVHNVDILLANHRVHGDLSAYNILYWEGRISLIDFPQVIDPRSNRSSYTIFQRDITRICQYFISQGVRANPQKLARDLWSSHGYLTAPEVHPTLLDGDDQGDRKYWEKISKNSRS